MSEVTQTDPTEAMFKSLESLHMDPKLSAILNKVDAYSKLLEDTPVTMMEIHDIIVEIDTEWDILVGEKASFTGVAQFPNEQIDGYPVSTDFYEDQSVIFRGVIAGEKGLEENGAEVEYEQDAEETEIFYELGIGLTRTGISHNGNVVQVDGIAKTAYIASLEFSHTMSQERAIAILEEQQPELIGDIDRALLNEAEDEGELALRLAGLRYELSGDEKIDAFVNQALNLYTNKILIFDQHNGYEASFEGMLWIENNEGVDCPAVVQAEALVKVSRVVWARQPPGEDVLVPHVELRVCSPEVQDTEEMIHIHAPLAIFDELYSLRHQYHNQEETGEDEHGSGYVGHYDI